MNIKKITMYTQPLSNEPLKPFNWKDILYALGIALVMLILAICLFGAVGCSSVKKHKSASEFKIDTSGSVYVKNVEVKSKDTSSTVDKKESNSKLSTIDIDDTTTLNFGDTGELKKPTVIEQNGTKITTYQPIKNITSKHKSKVLNKDTSSNASIVTTKSSGKDSTAKEAEQNTSKKASGSQSEIGKEKIDWALFWWLIFIAFILITWCNRYRILNWWDNRKLKV